MDYKSLDAFRLENHVTIVTGAGDGIGRCIAELFAQVGSAVVVSDRNDQAAVEVAQLIKDDGGKSRGHLGQTPIKCLPCAARLIRHECIQQKCLLPG